MNEHAEQIIGDPISAHPLDPFPFPRPLLSKNTFTLQCQVRFAHSSLILTLFCFQDITIWLFCDMQQQQQELDILVVDFVEHQFSRVFPHKPLLPFIVPLSPSTPYPLLTTHGGRSKAGSEVGWLRLRLGTVHTIHHPPSTFHYPSQPPLINHHWLRLRLGTVHTIHYPPSTNHPNHPH